MGLFGGDDDSPLNKAAGAATTVGGFAVGGVPGLLVNKDVRKTAANAVGMGHDKQDALADQSAGVSAAEQAANRGVLDQMNAGDKDYLDTLNKETGKTAGDMYNYKTDYIAKLDQTGAEAANQAKNARAVYSNDIQPRLKSQMEDAQKQAGSAMSLADAGNPNNSVQTAVRGMYDQQAQGVQKQGLADYGVLAALGNQATMNTMGGAGGPMTGAQLGMLSANNSRNASQAYNIAANRMNNLKQQGIDRGFEESGKQYDRGVAANSRYDQSINNHEAGMQRNLDRENSYLDRDMGYASDRLGMLGSRAQGQYEANMGMNNAKHSIGSASANREMSNNASVFGNQQAQIANQMSAANAENAQKAGMFGAVLGTAGQIGGAYMGGAAGAQTGGNMGSTVAGGMAPYQTNYQQPPRR